MICATQVGHAWSLTVGESAKTEIGKTAQTIVGEGSEERVGRTKVIDGWFVVGDHPSAYCDGEPDQVRIIAFGSADAEHIHD
nr:hypothetical protein NG677_05045 [Methylobacterium sp. OTU13CASTA1]